MAAIKSYENCELSPMNNKIEALSRRVVTKIGNQTKTKL